MHPKWQQEEEGTENDVAEGASLGRQVLLPASSPICVRTGTATTLLDDGRTSSVFHISFFCISIFGPDLNSSLHIDPGTGHIKVYSFYEIDRTKLPVSAPDHLKSIRIVMV